MHNDKNNLFCCDGCWKESSRVSYNNRIWKFFAHIIREIFLPSLYNGYPLLGEGSKLALHTPNEVEQVLYKVEI